ncbi:MAG: thiamine phosphate synthase [Prevotellaceae bacterium]|nr:thiamine phosphate synthase [Prevotellaceae bacterium]
MKGLLFITHRSERFGYLQSAEIALAGGCRQIQFRMKDALSSDEFESTAREVKKLCDDYGADLYINDRVEVCARIGAKGVHLGKLDMQPSEARAILGSGFVIGGTANTFDDIRRLYNDGVDYIGLGPFRFTNTKQNLSPILGSDGYSRIIGLCREHQIDIPLIAIGGITSDEVASIMRLGVSGVAMSSSILNSVNPKEEVRKIIKIICNEE